MSDGLSVLPVRGIGQITPGTDLAEAITTAAPWLRDGDVLVVTSKIVSKAEGQLIDVPADGPEREEIRDRLVVEQTARPVARRGATRIVATHHGFVMAAAGIDASNVEQSQLVLLPKDPDASARSLRTALAERYGLDVAVIISDTMGRPWREGLTDVALGAAGIAAILDYRGEVDPYGNELQLTQMAIVDELSGAAELVKGKCDQVPVAVIRGYLERPTVDDDRGATALIRDSSLDLFSLGTAEAKAAGLANAATLPDATIFGGSTVESDRIHRVLAGVPLAPTTTVDLRPDPLRLLCSAEPQHQLALGIDVHRLRCALAADGLATTLVTEPPGAAVIAIGLPL